MQFSYLCLISNSSPIYYCTTCAITVQSSLLQNFILQHPQHQPRINPNCLNMKFFNFTSPHFYRFGFFFLILLCTNFYRILVLYNIFSPLLPWQLGYVWTLNVAVIRVVLVLHCQMTAMLWIVLLTSQRWISMYLTSRLWWWYSRNIQYILPWSLPQSFLQN